MTRIGVQVHTFRDVDDKYPAILRRIAENGYQGVEFAHGIHDADTRTVAAVLSETSLDPIGAHVPLPHLERDLESLVDQYATLGCSNIVIPHVSGTCFLTGERVEKLARRLNDLADRLDDRGFELIVHNNKAMHKPLVGKYGLTRVIESGVVPTGGYIHAASLINEVLPGHLHRETGFDRLLAATDGIAFEIDVEHAVATGTDPHRLFETVGERLFAVHISDGKRMRMFPPAHQSTPLGDGSVDIGRQIHGAIRHEVKWLIGEVDDPPVPALAFESVIAQIEDYYPHI